MIKRILDQVNINRQQTPLTDQVKASAQPQHINLLHNNNKPITPKVTFELPPSHVDKDSTKWRKTPKTILQFAGRLTTSRDRSCHDVTGGLYLGKKDSSCLTKNSTRVNYTVVFLVIK